jgi:uncharacterized phage protein gp47/JayE
MAHKRYEDQTYEEILQRMLDRLPVDIDKREGSVTYDMLAPAAAELAQAYIELQNVLDFGFMNTAYGEYIDLRAEELGIYRKEATQSNGYLHFTGRPGTEVPKDTKVSTTSVQPVFFLTQATLILDELGAGIVYAKAEEGGKKGNIALNKITLVHGDLNSLIQVNNPVGFEGGTDNETDDDLIERYSERVQRPIASGNINDYLVWAREVEGVGEAKCYPLWNGNGTVKIVITDSNRRTPTQDIIDRTILHIEEERPVGALVTVVGAAELAINLSALMTLEPGKTLADAELEIIEKVDYYLSQIAFEDNIVRYNYIAALVLQCDSVIDYTDLLVNGLEDTNILVGDEEIPVRGMVSLT